VKREVTSCSNNLLQLRFELQNVFLLPPRAFVHTAWLRRAESVQTIAEPDLIQLSLFTRFSTYLVPRECRIFRVSRLALDLRDANILLRL
jgi:hypothetical protein